MDGPAQGDELTSREVAAALGVAERTVLSYVERGLITSRVEWKGLRRQHVFTREALEQCRQLIAGVRAERE